MKTRLLTFLSFVIFHLSFCPIGAQTSQPPVATVYTTDGTRQYSLTPTQVQGEESTNVRSALLLHPEETYQSVDGFGFAITYSSAYNLLKMTAADRAVLLRKTFSPTEGYGASYVRISLGCNDFSSTEYSLCDEKGPDDDLLKHFRLYTDETNYVIPVLKELLAINPQLKIIAAPWTCPKWMKVNNITERRNHDSWTDGHLNPAYYKAYAQYFVRFVKAFAAEGISIYAVSPQNEPLNPGNCASLYMPWNEQAGFVQQLAPALKQAGLKTRIYLFDHNYNYDNKPEEQQYPAKIYKVYEGKDFEGKELVVGAAYHNYGGHTDELNVIHNLYPDKELLFTEASIGTWNNGRHLDSSLADCMVNIGLHTLNKHCRGAIVWNFMLDMQRGPNLDGGCQTCYGAVDIDESNYRDYTLNSHYYTICHLSAVVRPGAVRIGTSGWHYDGVTYTAFRNPDGTMAVVLYNANQGELGTNIATGQQRFHITLPPRAAVSVLLPAGQATGVGAPSALQAMATPTYYTLGGTKATSLSARGIYISQGRKEARNTNNNHIY